MREDALDHRRFEDGADDITLTTTIRAVLEVVLEDALEQPGPERSVALLPFVSDRSWPSRTAHAFPRTVS